MSIEFANNSTLSQKDEFDSVPSKNSSLPPMENYKENGHDQEQEKRQIDVITPTDSQNQQQQQQQQQQQESSSSSSSQSQSQSQSSMDSPSSISSLPFSNTVQDQLIN
ncbi:unnamed protein product [[Candida] boidinii]|uniref:Unnamed protein product n=1 Tax=Candida boidinii TaxID=5477 RepID=A0ACB5U8K8_CANBO|nr:unnamed protein product [[Candida] boidinii]